jgi:hypothetical protein
MIQALQSPMEIPGRSSTFKGTLSSAGWQKQALSRETATSVLSMSGR